MFKVLKYIVRWIWDFPAKEVYVYEEGRVECAEEVKGTIVYKKIVETLINEHETNHNANRTPTEPRFETKTKTRNTITNKS